jgi:hypothetical protein
VVASPSFAARHSSLSGNLLIQDTDDIFFFPHLVSMYNRMVTFDFGTNSGLGSGGMVFGGETVTLGLFAHRSDFIGAIPNAYLTRGDIDNINNDGEVDFPFGFPNALNWVDLLVGWGGKDGGNPWGIRFSVGRNNNDPDPDNVGADATAFNVIAGTRFNQWGAFDASVEFSIASLNDDDAINSQEASPWHLAAGIRRTPGDESDALRLGYLAMLSYLSGTNDITPVAGPPGTSTDFSSLNFVVGAGPVYKPNDRTNVAMYGTFEYDRNEGDNGTLSSTDTEVVIPGWNVAAEVEIASWLQFRSGLRSKYTFVSNRDETVGPPPVETEDKSNRLDFDWTTGIGVQWGNFTLDGFLDPSVMTSGTDLLGNSDDLFGMVTTTLRF